MLFLKKIVKYLVALFYHYSGLNENLIRKHKKLYILMFHKISATVDYLHMSIKPGELQTIVNWSKNYGEITNLSDITNLKKNCCSFCITFDDGYKNNLRFIKYCPGVSATIYLATSYIGTGKRFWADKMQTSILKSSKPVLDLADFELGQYELTTKNNKKLAIRKLNIILKQFHPKIIEKIIYAIGNQLGFWDSNEEVFLNWADIKNLKEQGIEIGSHTHNHVITTNVSRKELENEFRLSNKIIEENTNCKVRHFAYPNGTKNDICEYYAHILPQYGYKTAVTTVEGFNQNCRDPYLLKRINVTTNRITNPFGEVSKAMFTTLLSNPFRIH